MPLEEPSPLGMDRFSSPSQQIKAMPPPGAPSPLPDGRGIPVYTQTPEEMEADRRTLRRGALMMLSLIPLLCILFYLVSGWTTVCRLNLVVLAVVATGSFGALALWMFYASLRVRPWRMYEDGVAFTTYPNLVDRYYLYAAISQLKEVSDNVSGNMVTVRWPGMEGINLHMENPRTPEILAFLRRKMGGPAQIGPEVPARPLQQLETVVSGPAPTTFSPEPFRHETKFYLAGLLVALAVSSLLLFIVPSGSRAKYWYLPLALFPTMAVNCLALTTMVMELYVRARKLPVKFDVKKIGALLLVLNLLVVAEVAVADPVSDALGGQAQEIVNTPAPAAGAVLPDVVADRVLELNESLLVAPLRTLMLENCTVRFHCASPRQYSLWVAGGGRLEARNCSFSAVSEGKGFGCELHGSALLVNCSFDNLWGDPQRLNGDGGVEVWNDDVRITGCRIFGAATNGLFIVRSSPVVTDTTIFDCDDEDVEMHRSSAVFTNCTLRDAGWGIIAWDGSRLRMEGCRVSGMKEDGVSLIGSEGWVLNCTLEDIGGSAIDLRDSELVSYEGTTFSRVGEKISESGGLGINLFTCLAMNVMLSLLTVGNLLLSGRRRSVAGR